MAEQKVIMTDPRQEDYFYQEAIKTLRTNIQFAGMDVKTILFTSSIRTKERGDYEEKSVNMIFYDKNER